MAAPPAVGVYGRLRKLLQFAAAAAMPMDAAPGAVFAPAAAAPAAAAPAAAAPAAPAPPPVMVTQVYLADALEEPYMVSNQVTLHRMPAIIWRESHVFWY
jgi:hypothetical protein